MKRSYVHFIALGAIVVIAAGYFLSKKAKEIADVPAMSVQIPPQRSLPPTTDYRNVMHLILGRNNEVYYWVGVDSNEVPLKASFKDSSLKNAILNYMYRRPNPCKGVEIAAETGCWDPIFLVKPLKRSRYLNLATILDELKAMKAKHAADDLSEVDSIILDRHGYL